MVSERKIKLISDNLNIEEIVCSVTGGYDPKETTVKRLKNDIEITIDTENYYEKIFGAKLNGKYFFARHRFINKKPEINYYDEFFSADNEILFENIS